MTKLTTRRKFLLGSTALLSVPAFMVYQRQNNRNNNQQQPQFNPTRLSLRSIIDTLVPEDDTPGAISLGIDAVMIEKMDRIPKTRTLIHRLIESVNKGALTAHQQGFALLNIDQREQLLLGMLERSAPQRSRFDLQRVRQEVLKAFYSTPNGQGSINYASPNRYPSYTLVA